MTQVTAEQKALIERFRTAFNRAERHLRVVLNEDEKTSVRQLINKYGTKHPIWRNNDGRLWRDAVENLNKPFE